MVSSAVYAQQQPWIATAVENPQAPTVFQAEKLSGRPDIDVSLEREVEIKRGSTVINADVLNFDVVDDRVDAEGNVRIVKEGDRFRGNKLRIKLDTGIGTMDSVVYRLLRRNAQGYAERIDFESEDVASIHNGVYTTCEGVEPDWYLRTGRLTLDEGAGIGYARNAVLVFKGVPVAGTPKISFPLTEERLSGFLAPSFATSSTNGLQLTTPYYWNIAPNRDVTLYPRYFARRGVMLGADARYLEPSYAGETRFEFMNDAEVPDITRYAVSTRHNQVLAPRLNFTTDLNQASDDNYYRDFPLSHVWERPGMNRRLLPQTASLAYGDSDWNANFVLHQFQVLQDPRAVVTVPYGRLPQINLNAFRYTDSGFDMTVSSQYTRFSHPTAVQGDRLVLSPRITYNDLQGAGYFLRPSVSAHATVYSLDRVSDSAMTAPARLLPSLSLDSGLIFEREARFLGNQATQTLEPRLYYTYTPYIAQNASLYPNFDTSEADISYSQIFRENRFVGNDRIGDASHLTLAMTSRFLEINGVERLRTSIAQRFNLRDPRVGLGTVEQTVVDSRSDVLLLTSGRVNDTLRLDANFQYNQVESEINRVNFGIYWQPAAMKVANLQYRRDTRDLANIPNTNFELIDVSGQWPLADRWYGVGRVNYLLNEKRLGQSLLGIEYQADCWIFRAVAQKIPTAFGVSNTSMFLQIEFNGLSSIGTNPLKAIRGNVPGYQPLTQPQ